MSGHIGHRMFPYLVSCETIYIYIYIYIVYYATHTGIIGRLWVKGVN